MSSQLLGSGVTFAEPIPIDVDPNEVPVLEFT
jgi:hypothetical protein